MAPHLVNDLTAADFGEPCDGYVRNDAFGKFNYTGTGPIMVIGGKNDPATPFVWAERMSSELGDSAFLVTFTGEGHTSFISNKCVTDLVDLFFVKTAKPDGSLSCDTDKALEIPAWFNETALPANFVSIDIGESMALFGVDPAVSYLAAYSSTSSPSAVARDLVKPLSAQYWTLDTQQSGSIAAGTSNTFFAQDDGRVLVFAAVSKQELLNEPAVASVAAFVPDGGSVVLKISGPLP